MSGEEDRGIPVNELSVQQLQGLRQGLDQEIEQLTSSLRTLGAAMQGYRGAHSASSELREENHGKDMMVPLTQSLYVPGRVSADPNVLVDVGTGYFVEKSVPKALEYFEGKMDFVRGNAEKVNEILHQKKRMREQVVGVLQQKVQAAAATQKA